MNWDQFSQIDLEAIVLPQIYERGVNYFREGQLIKACKFGEMLAGILIGTGGNYRVRLWLSGSGLRGDCSCPYQGFCKHMVALAVGWLEKRSEFVDLKPPLIQMITDPSILPDVLQRLIEKDPVNFLELLPEQVSSNEFITTRGILNLIRNTFSISKMTTIEAELFWDQVRRAESLIIDCFINENPDAPILLAELIAGMAEVLKNYKNEALINHLAELLNQLQDLEGKKSLDYLQPVLEKLLELYFTPALYEVNNEVRIALVKLAENAPTALLEKIQIRFKPDTSLLELILIHDLFLAMVEKNGQFVDWLARVKEQICLLPDGRLWLIDRLMETDLEQALKIAQNGLRFFPEEKRAFRERLITIHQQKNELKQAAALSFIQFQDEPNFDEYQRLKNLLTPHPADWQGYLKRMKNFLLHNGRELLAIQIDIDQQDYESVIQNFANIMTNESLLLAMAQLFRFEVPQSFERIYPALIKALITRGAIVYWKPALELVLVYKKFCYQQGRIADWEILREELNRHYQDNPAFLKKFGRVLAG